MPKDNEKIFKSLASKAVAKAEQATNIIKAARKRGLSMFLRPGISYEQKLQQAIDHVMAQRLLYLTEDLAAQQNDVAVYNPWIQDIINHTTLKSNKALAATMQAEILQKPEAESLALFLLKYGNNNDASTEKLLDNYLSKLHEDIENEKKINPAALENIAKVEKNIADIIEFMDSKIDPASQKVWNPIKENILEADRNYDFAVVLGILKSEALSDITKKFAKEDSEAIQQLTEQFKTELITQPIAKIAARGHFDIYLIPIAAIMANSKADADTKVDLTAVASSLSKHKRLN